MNSYSNSKGVKGNMIRVAIQRCKTNFNFYTVLFYILATLELFSTLNVRVVELKKLRWG